MKRTALLFGGLVLGTAGIAQAEPVRFESGDAVDAYEPFWAGRESPGLTVTASFAEHPVFPLRPSHFEELMAVSSTEWNYAPHYGLAAFGGPATQKGLLVQSLASSLVVPLEAGDKVTAETGPFGAHGIMASGNRDFEGTWSNYGSLLPDSEVSYVGVRFPIDGAQHYGWVAVRLSPLKGGYPQIGTASGDFLVQLLAWGYESEPDTPAFAGAPSCSSADIAAPYGELTFADITAFLTAFAGGTILADYAAPFQQLTFADITAYLAAFSAGCP